MTKRNLTILGGLLLGCGVFVSLRDSGQARGVARALEAKDDRNSVPARPATGVAELKVAIKEWEVPTKGAHPHDPAVGGDGALWFTEQLQNKIGRVDPKTGAFKEYPLKVEDSGPHGLVADSDGNIWFTVQVANMVGRLDPRTGKIDLKTPPTANSHPYGIAVNHKGIPFFCEFNTNKMAKIDPQTMEITEFKLPEGARPRRMAIDASDNVYFTDYSGGNLGRLDPATGAVKMWPSPGGAGSAPYGITITLDGLVWYSESGVKPNTIVQFNPKTEQFARAAIPSGGGTVRNMAATSDGRVYLACSGVNKVGVVERLP